MEFNLIYTQKLKVFMGTSQKPAYLTYFKAVESKKTVPKRNFEFFTL